MKVVISQFLGFQTQPFSLIFTNLKKLLEVLKVLSVQLLQNVTCSVPSKKKLMPNLIHIFLLAGLSAV